MAVGRVYAPYACFLCRKSFKREVERDVTERPCPLCGQPASLMSRKFRTPRSSDKAQWEKVRILREHGFLFHSLYDETGRVVVYPAKLSEVPAFLEEFGHQIHKTVSTATVVRSSKKPKR